MMLYFSCFLALMFRIIKLTNLNVSLKGKVIPIKSADTVPRAHSTTFVTGLDPHIC